MHLLFRKHKKILKYRSLYISFSLSPNVPFTIFFPKPRASTFQQQVSKVAPAPVESNTSENESGGEYVLLNLVWEWRWWSRSLWTSGWWMSTTQRATEHHNDWQVEQRAGLWGPSTGPRGLWQLGKNWKPTCFWLRGEVLKEQEYLG